jgi:hypothetical protein
MPMLTAKKIIDMFGGPTAMSRHLAVSPQAVVNWRQRGLPSDKFASIAAAAKDLNIDLKLTDLFESKP